MRYLVLPATAGRGPKAGRPNSLPPSITRDAMVGVTPPAGLNAFRLTACAVRRRSRPIPWFSASGGGLDARSAGNITIVTFVPSSTNAGDLQCAAVQFGQRVSMIGWLRVRSRRASSGIGTLAAWTERFQHGFDVLFRDAAPVVASRLFPARRSSAYLHPTARSCCLPATILTAFESDVQHHLVDPTLVRHRSRIPTECPVCRLRRLIGLLLAGRRHHPGRKAAKMSSTPQFDIGIDLHRADLDLRHIEHVVDDPQQDASRFPRCRS
jgi:hypothetical protein